jgi:hypothetical protein
MHGRIRRPAYLVERQRAAEMDQAGQDGAEEGTDELT